MYSLGTYNVVDPDTGLVIDCDSWSNLFNLTCWGGNSITGAGTGPYAGYTTPTNPTDATVSVSSDGTITAIAPTATPPVATPPTLASMLTTPVVMLAGGALILLLVLGGRR